MGTASTMACLTEALGIAPLGSACPPANGGQRLRVAELTGKLAATKLLRPSEVLTRASFENAITVLQAIGGSTNAIVHLLAIAGRMPGVNLTLADFDRIGRKTPLLVDLKPSGANYMEDFYRVSFHGCLLPLADKPGWRRAYSLAGVAAATAPRRQNGHGRDTGRGAG